MKFISFMLQCLQSLFCWLGRVFPPPTPFAYFPLNSQPFFPSFIRSLHLKLSKTVNNFNSALEAKNKPILSQGNFCRHRKSQKLYIEKEKTKADYVRIRVTLSIESALYIIKVQKEEL
jgi:hypothetical protein